MNDNLDKMFEFFEFLASVLDESNGDLKNNVQIKNIYNSIKEDSNAKELLKGYIDKFPIINFDNALNLDNMSIDECIVFLKRLASCLTDISLEKSVNKLYDDLIIDIKQQTPFLYKNLSKFSVLSQYHTKNIELVNYELCDIPTMSFEETTKMVSDFFGYIDPSKKLKNSFDKYLKAGNICAWNKKEGNIPDIIIKNLYPNDYGDWGHACDSVADFINAPLNNDLYDSFSLIHEFLHYYISECDYGDNKLLREFPSIFFETIFAKYLINLGYEKEIINGRLFFRINGHLGSQKLFEDIYKLIIKKENKEDIKISDFANFIDEDWVINNFPSKYLDEFLPKVREVNEESRIGAREKMAEQLNEVNYKSITVILSYLLAKCFTDRILEKESDIVEASKKVLAVKDIITSNDMSFHYLLSYFELWDYYYILENSDKYNSTVPKRIEDKQLAKK